MTRRSRGAIRGDVGDFVAAEGNVRFQANAARPAGLNGDGAVDGVDLGFLLGAPGACP